MSENKMESQLQKTHDTHGRHYDEHDALAHVTEHNEDEHHEKKSVIKKVKEKAKKLKNTITKHGHGHEHEHDHDEDDDDDEETVEDPEVHGAPMRDSSRVGHLGGPDAILSHQRVNLEKPSVMAEDRYTTKPLTGQGPVPPVSTGPYGTNLSEQSGLGHGLGLGHGHTHTEAYGHEVHPDTWRHKVGQPTGMEEDPFSPNPTPVTGHTHGMKHVSSDPVRIHGEGHNVNKGKLKNMVGKSTAIPDPHGPNDPSRMGSNPPNYQSKVTDPTHTGGKVDLSQMQHSFERMGVGSDPKSYDPNHPENLPRDTLTGNQKSKTSSYTDKISSSASAIADKAAAAKDVVASRLGYSGETPTTRSQETVQKPGTVTDYAHKITDTVTGTLAPVYEKVVDAGSSLMSKVQGTVSGSGTGTGTGAGQTHVEGTGRRTGQTLLHGTGTGQTHVQGDDKGVSVKEYLLETLKPGDEDKALSDRITHALHRGHEDEDESEKKSREDRPMGIVTESVEVRRRLGTDRNEEQQQHNPSNVTAEKNVSDRLRDAVGSWFGGKGDAPQGTLGTSYVTDQGLSSNPRGDQKSGSGQQH